MRRRRSIDRFALLMAGAVAFGSCTGSTEPLRPTSITIAPATVTLDAVGATQQLTATVLDQKGNPLLNPAIVWSSTVSSTATVSTAGLVSAVANGSASIEASIEGVMASRTVQVAQVPVSPVVIEGDAQSGTVQSALATPVRVRIEDRLGNPMVGRAVTFAVTAGGGSIGSPNVTSAADGTASTTWTLGASTVSLQRVGASVAGNVNVTVISATALAGPAVTFGIAPGNTANGQRSERGKAVPIRPAVEVVDALGNGVAGATVTFSVLTGGGGVTGATATTNITGIATVGSWVLGPVNGANTLQASVPGLPPVVFTATGTDDPCTPGGAIPIAIGQTHVGSILASDCALAAPDGRNFDLYRLDVAVSTAVIIDLSGTFDTWLYVFDFNTLAPVADNDDIVSGVIQDSRIALTLPAGSYLLRATSFDPGQTGTYSIGVRASVVGVAASISIVAGNGQVAAPNTPLPIAPSVVVRDEGGTGVAGITVDFAAVAGVGLVTGASVVTDANGVATVGSWTVASGANVLSATIAGGGAIAGNPAVFSSRGKASTAGFDISLRFVAMPTVSQLTTFSNAADRWESIITGDLPGQPLNLSAGACNSPTAITETIDDVAIIVRLEPIDGPGQVLGSAGPCVLRGSGTSLPALGTMRFDTADLANLEAGGNFGNVILHEMGHVLGIGTVWQNKGLLLNPSLPSSSGADTHFTGTEAIAGFNLIGGSTWTGGSKVPVENTQGGAGTRDSHWREGVLQNELMTGFLNAGSNPLSQLTARSLVDIGYVVNTSQADSFFLTLSFRAAGEPEPAGLELKDDIRRGDVITVDRLGRWAGGTPPPVKKRAPRQRF